MRRSPLEEGRRWLDQASEDLRWADDLSQRGGYHIACAEASQRDPEFSQRARRWSILDGYYVAARYPNSLPDSIPARVYTEDAAREAVRLAGEIVGYVGQHLKAREGG